MSRLAMLGLGLCATALCGLIRLEYAPSPEPAPPSPVLADAVISAPVAPSSGDADRVRDWVATDLARPLFEPSRRPPATGTTTSPPRLTGIVISAGLRDAIFAASTGGRAIVVATGGRLDGMLIRSIDADGVVVVDAAGTRRLQPSFDREAGHAAPPPAVPASPPERPLFLMSDSTRPPPEDIGADTLAGLSFPVASGASP